MIEVYSTEIIQSLRSTLQYAVGTHPEVHFARFEVGNGGGEGSHLRRAVVGNRKAVVTSFLPPSLRCDNRQWTRSLRNCNKLTPRTTSCSPRPSSRKLNSNSQRNPSSSPRIPTLFPISSRPVSSSAAPILPVTHPVRYPGGILEIGAFHSIHKEDLLAFERYLNLLSPYYNDITYLPPLSPSLSSPY